MKGFTNAPTKLFTVIAGEKKCALHGIFEFSSSSLLSHAEQERHIATTISHCFEEYLEPLEEMYFVSFYHEDPVTNQRTLVSSIGQEHLISALMFLSDALNEMEGEAILGLAQLHALFITQGYSAFERLPLVDHDFWYCLEPFPGSVGLDLGNIYE